MPSVIYLAKDSDEGICHCNCSEALINFPPQMDCPWCGCGWLFSCMECGKAFTVARGIEVEATWDELARRGHVGMGVSDPDAEDTKNWIATMQSLLADVVVGNRYVYLDGRIHPAEHRETSFEGWYARHELEKLPHVPPVRDPRLLRATLRNVDYWKRRAVGSEAVDSGPMPRFLRLLEHLRKR